MKPRCKVEIQSDGRDDEDNVVTPRKATLGSESTREEVSAQNANTNDITDINDITLCYLFPPCNKNATGN